jgi:ElaB/YqjD/DUF883 family membrane-anchored ribosome-binding protein
MSHSIKDTAKHEANAAKNYYENAKDSVQDARDFVADKAEQYSKNIKSQMNDTEEKVISYTKDNPLKALGFAALLGYIISKVL